MSLPSVKVARACVCTCDSACVRAHARLSEYDLMGVWWWWWWWWWWCVCVCVCVCVVVVAVVCVCGVCVCIFSVSPSIYPLKCMSLFRRLFFCVCGFSLPLHLSLFLFLLSLFPRWYEADAETEVPLQG